MDGTNPITNDADVIDSRDVIARIDYLESCAAEAADMDAGLPEGVTQYGLDEVEQAELAALKAFAAEAENADDWIYGATLVRDSYFVDHIKELVEDCYQMPADFDSGAWPWRHMEMDWEAAADEAQTDYTDVTFDGVTYWVR
jgi:hypothetical protein